MAAPVDEVVTRTQVNCARQMCAMGILHSCPSEERLSAKSSNLLQERFQGSPSQSTWGRREEEYVSPKTWSIW